MKKLLFGVLTAFGVALGANAAIGTNETTFETDDTTVSVLEDKSLQTGTYWSVDDEEGTDVATTSKVMAYKAGEGVSKGSDCGLVGTEGMTTAPGDNYLQIDADNVLLRNIAENKTTLTLNGSYYIDTMVKFTATDLDDEKMAAEIAEDKGEKIVVWMYQREIPEGSTEIPAPVLKVAAGYIGAGKVQGNAVTAVDKKVYTATNVNNFQENTWYRLSVKAINNAYDGASAVYFVVCINGVPLTYTEKFYDTVSYDGIFAKPSMAYRSLSSSILPSLVPDATTLTGLGFKGNGAVDNILFSSVAPCDKLIDGSAVALFKVGEEGYATWKEAVNAAATGDTTIKLLTNEFTDSKGTTTHLKLDFNGVALDADKTVVLDLNGKTLESIKGTSIEILGNDNSTSKATVQIVDTVGRAVVRGDVIVDTCNAIIGDVSENDKGVIYAGTLNAFGSTIKLYKGKFVKDPTVPTVEGMTGAKVADGYGIVKEGDYWTIAKVTLTEYDLTVTVVGEGVDSVTVTTNGVVVQDFTSGTPIKVLQDAKVTITTTVADWYKAVDPQKFDMPAENKTVTISTTKIVPEDDIGESTSGADVGITGGYFKTATGEEVKNVVNWATNKGVSIDVVNLMNFESPTTREEAYLLNCANTEEAVDAAKKEFKITVDFVNGEFTPTWPTGYNGKVQKKGATKIGANADWTEVTEDNQGTFKFFRAFLTK